LYYSELDEKGNWKHPEELPFNSDHYSTGHPAITSDGETLYFVSDRPGGYGFTDIYFSNWKENSWDEPVNLGHSVNTEGSEMFPFCHADGTLYFSSDGHVGLGGLDIYKYKADEHNEPVNIGYPMNTSDDDFGFIEINTETGSEGFFSSNRDGGLGEDDIYQFLFEKPKYLPITGIVVDKRTGEPLPGSDVTLNDSFEVLLESVTADVNAKFSFIIKDKTKYIISATRENYSRDEETVNSEQLPDGNRVIMEILAKPLVVKGTIYHENTQTPLDSSKLIVTVQGTGEKFGIITGKDGKYSFIASPDEEYYLLAEKHEHFSEHRTFSTMGITTGEIIHDFHLKQIFIGKPITLENIYFDHDKTEIRRDAVRALDLFVIDLHENPEIIIELSTHTDSQGSDDCNLTLSEKRAHSVDDYITSQGIDPSRIISRGYGEQHLLNECKNDVECDDEQHEENRRAECKVTGFREEEVTAEEKGMFWVKADHNFSSQNIELVMMMNDPVKNGMTFTGTVFSTHGLVVRNALVTIIDEQNFSAYQSSTDLNGQFSLIIEKEATYKIFVTREGYFEMGLENIHPEKDQNIRIQIHPVELVTKLSDN
jgi:outer membrane protein OmpA-like peptidoglycan-associated protein